MKSSHLANIVKDTKRKGLDTSRRGILFRVTAKLTVEAEVSLVGAYLMPRVQGPHAGEALADGA
jgi:hypothetical protein